MSSPETIEASPEPHLSASSASSVASLEPALLRRLKDAGSPAEAARAWLALQCQMIEGATRGIVLLSGGGPNSFEAAGFWPEGSGKPAALAEVAEIALRERRSVANDDRSPAADGSTHVAVPILVGTDLEGAVAVTLRSGRTEDGGKRCGNCNGAWPGSASGFVRLAPRCSTACWIDPVPLWICSAAHSIMKASMPPRWRPSPVWLFAPSAPV